MKTGFLDESGTLLPDGSHDAYTIALLVTSDPKRIEVLIRRLRHSLHRRARTSELKAAQSHPRVVRRVLNGLVAAECEIFALVFVRSFAALSNSGCWPIIDAQARLGYNTFNMH